MGRVTATITVTNEVDKMLVERGFIPAEQIRSVTIYNVLVDTGATRLCLPADIISQLGLTLVGEIQGNTAIGSRQFRLFKNVGLAVAGREGRYDCIEIPAGEEPLLGLIPLEDLGLEPDLRNQRLIVLPAEGMQSYSTFQVSEVHNRGRDTAVPCPYGNRRAIGVYFINVESAVYSRVKSRSLTLNACYTRL